MFAFNDWLAAREKSKTPIWLLRELKAKFKDTTGGEEDEEVCRSQYSTVCLPIYPQMLVF